MEEKMQSEAIGNLATALAMAQGEIKFALKDSVADMGMKGGKRKYADLQSVIDAIKAPLAKNGLAYIQSPMSGENGIILRTTLCHKSGEWIASEFFLPTDRMGGIQGMGSALTYARRYALSAMVGVAADEDDDGETSQAAWRNQQAKQQAPAKQQTARQTAPNPDDEVRKAFFEKAKKVYGTDKTALLKGLSEFYGRKVSGSSELLINEMKEFIAAAHIDAPKEA